MTVSSAIFVYMQAYVAFSLVSINLLLTEKAYNDLSIMIIQLLYLALVSL